MAQPGLIVRPERPEDQVTARAVVAAAFGDEPVADLLDGLRGSPAWLGLSFVAEREGQVVGHVAFSRGWVDAPERLVEVLVLSPLSVLPDEQGRGIGSALVRRSLELLEPRREPLVFLEGSPRFYSRLGFLPAGSRGFTAPSVRIPELAFQVWPRAAYEPWMRGALVYPDVFWRHDAVGLRHHPDS